VQEQQAVLQITTHLQRLRRLPLLLLQLPQTS
jgi:hypothetical protein